MITLTDYQQRAYPLWKENGYRGIIKSPTGSGKTILGCECIRLFRQEHPDTKIVIVTTAGGKEKKVKNAWIKELKNFGIDNVEVYTYLEAGNVMRKKRNEEFLERYDGEDPRKMFIDNTGVFDRVKEKVCDKPMYDLMIADECHRLANPEEGKVMGMNPFFILGLSATPEDSVKILGRPIDNISVDEARVCPFTVHMLRYDPTPEEMVWYEKKDKAMKEWAVERGAPEDKPYLIPGSDPLYDRLIRERREICYTFGSRIPIVVRLVKKHHGERIVIFTERTEHAHLIEMALRQEGIPCSMNVKDKNTFKDFEEHKTNVLIMVKSLREGWDDPTLSVCIMASLTTRPKIITQTMGRTMRINPSNPNKHAHNYLILANKTSDERVKDNLDYPKDRFKEDTLQTVFAKTLEEWT